MDGPRLMQLSRRANWTANNVDIFPAAEEQQDFPGSFPSPPCVTPAWMLVFDNHHRSALLIFPKFDLSKRASGGGRGREGRPCRSGRWSTFLQLVSASAWHEESSQQPWKCFQYGSNPRTAENMDLDRKRKRERSNAEDKWMLGREREREIGNR